MGADVKPFPWDRLPRVSRRSAVHAAQLAAAAALPGRAEIQIPGVGRVALAPGAPVERSGRDLAAALSDPTSAVVVVRAGGVDAHLVVPGRLVRDLGQRLLGGPDELDAPRAPTPAERGALTYAVAAVLDALAPAAQVEPVDLAGPLVAAARSAALLVDVELAGDLRGRVTVVAPPPPWPVRHRPLADLVAARGGWLAGLTVEAPAVVARAAVGRDDLVRLRIRDVLVVDRVGAPDAAEIRVARGRVPARLASAAGGLTVIGTYERGSAVQESLGDDTTVEISVAAGAVTLPLRQLLELAPGQVLSLNRPLGGTVELRVGPRVVGRGELVDVDGELGVRVLALEDTLVARS